MRFIYVMDADSKDLLVSKGFNLLKYSQAKHTWVFLNPHPDELNFAVECPHVASDVLTF